MRTKEREEELYAIAEEIFSALSCERYEPSERGAGWAPTDKGYEDVIAILARSRAKMWKDSPAERRAVAISNAKVQAHHVAKRLLGNNKFSVSQCTYCNEPIYLDKGSILWHTTDGSSVIDSDVDCLVRISRKDRYWNHQPIGSDR